jgi:hypothetical protein
MRKILVCAALVALAAAGAVGQVEGARRGDAPSFARLEDVSAEASRLLGSRDGRARAWGAYLAGAHGLKGHAPLVVALLENEGAAHVGSDEEALVRRAALDALIRLDAEVPSEKLLPLYQLAPDETVILLARAPEQNAAALLALFDDETVDARWFALGNLLAEARARGFAARLLAGLKLRATVFVYDSHGDRGYNGGGGDACGGSRHFESTPEGFPPAGRYTLSATPARGAVVVARGRRAVYYVRAAPGQGDAPYVPCDVVRGDEHRVEYLADLLRTTDDDLGLPARSFREVVCRDARQCRGALAALRDETARAYAEVLGRLAAAGLLDASEASTLKPDLTLDLYDQRDLRTFPLPEKLGGVRINAAGGGAN